MTAHTHTESWCDSEKDEPCGREKVSVSGLNPLVHVTL